jgi:hypothetical protein
MPKVVITAQVEDPVKWAAGFRTRGDLFRSYTVHAPIHFLVDGNEVTIVMEPEDLETFRKSLESPATVEGMKSGGVKRETVKFYYLDKQMTP